MAKTKRPAVCGCEQEIFNMREEFRKLSEHFYETLYGQNEVMELSQEVRDMRREMSDFRVFISLISLAGTRAEQPREYAALVKRIVKAHKAEAERRRML